MAWWEVLVQQTINGLTRGAVFALIALGYTMVYGIIELINFAHGDVFMLGLFISLAWFGLLGVTGTLGGWQLVTVLPLVFVLTMLTTAGLNVAIDRIAYRRRRPGRRGGTDSGHVLQHRYVVDGLSGGPACIHRRGAGRHRQHGRRRAGRPRHRLPLRVERSVHLGALDQRHRLLHSHHHARLPPARAARRAD